MEDQGPLGPQRRAWPWIGDQGALGPQRGVWPGMEDQGVLGPQRRAWPGMGEQGALGTAEEGVAWDRGPRGHWDQDGGEAWDWGAGVGCPPERVLLRARRPERWSVRSQVTF